MQYIKKAVFFDLDGTIWDSVQTIIPAWNRVLENCGRSQRLSVAQSYSLMGKTGEQIAALLFGDLSPSAGLELFRRCCREEHIDIAQKGGVLYEGVTETLADLSRRYFLAVISNCDPGYIESFIKYYGFEKYFTDFECAGATGLSKGENIKLVMKRNAVDKAVFVGDTQSDRDAAELAGIPFILAGYGFGNSESRYKAERFSQIGDIAPTILG